MTTYTAADVNVWFNRVQFRDGPTATVSAFVTQLNNGVTTESIVQTAIVNDDYTTSYVNPILRLYQGAFNHTPDSAGESYWVGQYATGAKSYATIASDFANSTEFKALYGNTSASNPINAATLNALYDNMFNRNPDGAGFTYWLNSGKTVAQVLEAFATSDEFVKNTKEALANFEQAQVQGIAPTTSNAGSLYEWGGPIPSASYTLTTAADTIKVTDGNTKIEGGRYTVYGSDGTKTTQTTFQAWDKIDGGTTIGNELYIVDQSEDATNYTPAAASVTNIQEIEVKNLNGDTTGTRTTTVDATKFSGATEFTNDVSIKPVAFTNLSKTQSVEVEGDGYTTVSDTTATWATSVTSISASVLDGVRGGNITLNATGAGAAAAAKSTLAFSSNSGINSIDQLAIDLIAGSTLNITANTALGINDITGGDIKTINVSGDAANVTDTTGLNFSGKVAVSLDDGSALNSAVTTVDASGLTRGGVYANLNTSITSFKGGAGNDIVKAAATTVATASISGGSGTGDRLIVDGSSNDIYRSGSQYTNFEILENAGAGILNASLISGITSVETSAGGGGFFGLSAAQAAAVKVTASLGGTATQYDLANSGGVSDALGLNFTNATSTVVENATNLNIGGFERLNLTAGSGGSSVYNGTTLLTAGTNYDSFAIGTATTDLKTVTLLGDYAAKVSIAANATKVTTLDASGNTAGAELAIGGQTGALVVTGTGAADYISIDAVGSGGTQTVNAGIGSDTIAATNAVFASAGLISLNAGTGTDTLKFTDTTTTITIADTTFSKITGTEKYTLANTTGDVTWTVGASLDSLVTAAGGVLDITASAFTTGDLTLDASALTGTNSLKLSTTSSGAAAAVAITTSAGGADSITVNHTGANGSVSVDGSGNSSTGIFINGSGQTTGIVASSLTGGTGADTIWGGDVTTGTYTITGGRGADTIVMQSGQHNVSQTLTVAANDSTLTNYDKVTNYDADDTTGTADQFNFTGQTVSIVADGTTTAYTATDTGYANLTASVTQGIITFGGTAAVGLALSDALIAAKNIDVAAGGAGYTSAFVYDNSTYVVEYNATASIAQQVIGVTVTGVASTTGLIDGAAGVFGIVNA